MKICFVIYPWYKVTLLYLTLRLIHEWVKRNYNVAITTPNDLGICDSVTIVKYGIFTQGLKMSPSSNSFRKNCQRYKERGVSELLNFWQDANDLVSLMVNKTSTGFYNTIVEIIDCNIVEKPQYITQIFENPQTELNNHLFDYILRSLK